VQSDKAQDTRALITRLQSHWLQDGVKIRAGATVRQIEEFETRYEARMPLDLLVYFRTIDGMNAGTSDSEMFWFLPLEAVRSLPEALGEHGQISAHHRIMGALSEPERWFVIVDYMIASEIFAIRLSDITENNPVLRYCDGHQIVASSFRNSWKPT